MSGKAEATPLVWELLTPHEDARGESYALPAAALEFLDAAREAHVATVMPGTVRGNHAHPHHRETLVVLFRDAWRLVWEGPDGTRHTEEFGDAGAAVVQIDTGVPHAIRNTGIEPLVIVSVSDRAGDNPGDTTRRTLELQGPQEGREA